MLSKQQKKELLLLMAELPKYVDEDLAQSALADLARASEETWEDLYQRIFIRKDWPREYKHPSVFIKRVFDHM